MQEFHTKKTKVRRKSNISIHGCNEDDNNDDEMMITVYDNIVLISHR